MAKGVTIDFNANVARFSSALDKATKDLNKFQSNTSRVANQASKAFGGLGKTIAGALTVGGFAAATKYALNYADGIADASEKTGFAVGKLQELRFAADQTGVSVTELEGGLARFTKRLGLARMGTGAAADTYRKLGIDLSQTNEQVFKQAVETLGSMESETNRLALATRLFGDDAQRLGVLFADGNVGLERFADKARQLGLVLSDDLVQGASDANDQLAVMKQVINIQTVKIFNALAPAITQMGQAFANAAPAVADFFSQFGNVDSMTKGAAEKLVRSAQKSFSEEQERLKLRLKIDADPSSAITYGLDSLFLPSEEVIRERMAYFESRFTEGINRLKEINTQSGPLQVQQIEAADLSGLFDDVGESAKGAASGVGELRDDLDLLLDIYEREELSNSRLWAEQEAGIKKTAKAAKDLKDKGEEVNEAWRDLGFTFESAFEDAIIEGEKLSDVLDGLAKDVLRMVARQTVTKPLANLVMGGIGNLFGFANGGSFMVGGAGGTDSQLVAFRASPNERVTIETPAQQRGGGGLAVSIGNIDARGSTNPAETEQAVFRAVRMAVNESVATMRDLKARGSLPEFA